jgi:glycosyltransferase involved in cell wall biosynthesis
LQRYGVEVYHGPVSFESFCRERAELYDVVILSRPEVAGEAIDEVRRSFPHARVVFDTVDIHFVRQQRRMAVEAVKAPPESDVDVDAQRDLELSLARRCDVTATVTEEEASLLEAEIPGVRTVVLPNVHETRAGDVPGFTERRDLLFIGSFEHPPNIDSVLWFVEQVLPLVEAAVDVRLRIIGHGAPPEIRALDGERVIIVGHVPDVTPHFDQARVFVAPLRYGAGMKGKNGHALSLGLPIVTTSIGAEGMHLVDGRDALIRDDAEAFAAAIVDLYGNAEMWRQLSCQGRIAAQRFSPAAMREKLAALVGL